MDGKTENDLPERHDPASELDQCFADLNANVAPEIVAGKLKTIEQKCSASRELKSRFLQARAIINNRLGFGDEALGCLLEARRIQTDLPDSLEIATIDLAIARVETWRGDIREAARALLRAAAFAAGRLNLATMASVFAESGRLEMEICHHEYAIAFFRQALMIDGERMAFGEWQRVAVNLLQALVATSRLDEAGNYLKEIRPRLSNGTPRQRFLAELESARIEIKLNRPDRAKSSLLQAKRFLTLRPGSFQEVEYAHATAELEIIQDNALEADRLLEQVIKRYASDDLAGREVQARLMHAKVLDRLKRSDEAEQTLLAALRRSMQRGLAGLSDRARSDLRSRGAVEGAWDPRTKIVMASNDDEVERRFVRRRPLGTGGFGKVSRAYDLNIGIEIALKKIRLGDIYDTRVREHILSSARTEITAASRIEHPGVAKVYGLLMDRSGDALIVQEYVEGPTLRASSAHGIDKAQACDILSRIAFTLSAIHTAGIVHRDLKLENIILRNGNSPTIVDFGIAFFRQTSDKTIGGTPRYMPPEQMRTGVVDARADLYALGVIACELLLRNNMSGSPSKGWPFLGCLFKRVRKAELLKRGLPAAAADLIAALFAPHRAFRPSSATAIGMAFRDLSAGFSLP